MKKLFRNFLFATALMIKTSYELNPILTCLFFIIVPICIGGFVGSL